MNFHPIASIFPLIEGQEYDKLVDDIKRNGLIEPIWQDAEGQIIDGRNRYRACQDADVEPRYRTWKGDGSLIEFVISLNLHRRHLTPGQKATLAVDILPALEEEARKRQIDLAGTRPNKCSDLGEKIPQGRHDKSSEKAAAVVGVNPRYVSDAKKLSESEPKLFNEVRSGKKTLTEAKHVVKEQEREQRRQINRDKVAEAPAANVAVSGAKFAAIVIDPPWDVGDEGDVNQLGRGKADYATLTIDQLLELPVEQMADIDCHLYLWITNRSLPKGFQLIERWGFRYITALTWVKPSFGMGNYFRGQTEHVLFAVRGSQMLKRKDVGTVFQAPRGKDGHSSKPNEFFSLVESCSPGPYLELFSRSERSGWKTWGENATA